MTPIELLRRVKRLRTEEAGQTMIEYAGLALLVSIAVIVLLTAIGLDIAEGFDVIENTLGIGATNTVPADPGVDDATATTGVN